MISELLQNNSTRTIVIFLSIVAISVLASWLAIVLFERVIKRLTGKTKTNLDDLIVGAVRRPLILFVVVLGLFVGSTFLVMPDYLSLLVGKSFSIALSLFAIYIAAALANALLTYYQSELGHKSRLGIDERLVALLRYAIPFIAGFLGLVLALNMAGVNVQFINDWLAQHGAKIGLILVATLVIILSMGQVLPRLMESAVTRGGLFRMEEETKKRADTLARVLLTATQAITILTATFMILSELTIDIAPVLAGAGVFGLAIGFGAQNLVRDFLAGLFILLENQYRVGDVVEIAGISGAVEDINLRRTILRDLDGIVHTVPNGEIKTASNFTRGYSRVNLNISVSYNENLDRVIGVINRVCRQVADDPRWKPYIIKTPQVLRVDNLGESGIDIKILGDTKPLSQWDIMGELRKRIKDTFDQEGIEIPWPHTKVYFGNPLTTKGSAPGPENPSKDHGKGQ